MINTASPAANAVANRVQGHPGQPLPIARFSLESYNAPCAWPTTYPPRAIKMAPTRRGIYPEHSARKLRRFGRQCTITGPGHPRNRRAQRCGFCGVLGRYCRWGRRDGCSGARVAHDRHRPGSGVGGRHAGYRDAADLGYRLRPGRQRSIRRSRGRGGAASTVATGAVVVGGAAAAAQTRNLLFESGLGMGMGMGRGMGIGQGVSGRRQPSRPLHDVRNVNESRGAGRPHEVASHEGVGAEEKSAAA